MRGAGATAPTMHRPRMPTAALAHRPVPWIAALLVAVSGAAAEVQGPTIIENRCLACHGPATHQGALDLSTRATALEGGTRGPALAPGDASGSLLLARVLADEMPPGSPLQTAEKETLRQWIAGGAEWLGRISEKRAGLDWWSLQPLAETPPPSAPEIPPEWRGTPVDRWILAGLQAHGLTPAPEVDRRTLIRRLSFDLLGLPPAPEEVEAFVRDRSPEAYERLVDRLLASPHYGERWGRHWLDLVRFAESEGFERDWLREHAWPYRDYVIQSFNEDKSYLRFAREQLAGDVLEPVTHAGIAATGFLTFGPLDAVGLTSAVARERAAVREDHLEELLGVVGQTFLGLTVNCARCHDHKFDPIPQTEYYRMKAAFQAIWPPTLPNTTGGMPVFVPHGRPWLTPAEQRASEEGIGRIRSRLEYLDAEIGKRYRSVRPKDEPSAVPRPRARWTFDTDGRADSSDLHLRFEGSVDVGGGRLRLTSEAVVEGDQAPAAGEDDDDPKIAVSPLLCREIRAKTLEAWLWVRGVPEKSVTLMELRGQSGFRGASVDGIEFVAGESPHWENYSIGRFRSQDPGGEPEQLELDTRIHVAIRYEADGTIAIFRNGGGLRRAVSTGRRHASGAAAGLRSRRRGDSVPRIAAFRDRGSTAIRCRAH